MTLYNSKKLKRIIELDKSVDGNNVLNLRKVHHNGGLNKRKLLGFDPNLLLDKEKQIPSAGNHFYEVGLSLFKFGQKDRKLYYNPFLILFLMFLLEFKWISSIFIPKKWERLHIYMADFTYILGIRFHLNPALVFMFLIIILTQIIHIRDYQRGERPNYLKPFSMIAGQCSPAEIGLTDEKDVYTMVKIMRIGVFLVQTFMMSIIGMNFLLILINCFNLKTVKIYYQLKVYSLVERLTRFF